MSWVLVAEPSCRLCFCYILYVPPPPPPPAPPVSGDVHSLFLPCGVPHLPESSAKTETASMSRLRIFARSAALDSRASSTDHSEPRNKRKANHKRGLGRWARKTRHTDSRGLPRPSSRASKEEPALAAVQRGWCSSAPPARRCPAPGRCGRLGTASPELHTAIQLLKRLLSPSPSARPCTFTRRLLRSEHQCKDQFQGS